MIRYRIVFTGGASRAYNALSADVRKRIDKRLSVLQDNPRPPGIKALVGAAAGAYRLRVGDYRVLYEVHDDQVIVLVLMVGHRREVYRRK